MAFLVTAGELLCMPRNSQSPAHAYRVGGSRTSPLGSDGHEERFEEGMPQSPG